MSVLIRLCERRSQTINTDLYQKSQTFLIESHNVRVIKTCLKQKVINETESDVDDRKIKVV